MTEELVTFPTAKLAREKGFIEQCHAGFEWYKYGGKEYGPTEMDMPEIPSISSYRPQERCHPNNSDLMKTMAGRTIKWPFFNNKVLPTYLYARPTQDLLERWLREVHRIVITIKYYVGPGYYYADLGLLSRALGENGVPGAPFDTYELAREAALIHALKLLP